MHFGQSQTLFFFLPQDESPQVRVCMFGVFLEASVTQCTGVTLSS